MESNNSRYFHWMSLVYSDLDKWVKSEINQEMFNGDQTQLEYYKIAKKKVENILLKEPAKMLQFSETSKIRICFEKIEKWTSSKIEMFNLKKDAAGIFVLPVFYTKAQKEVKEILDHWVTLIEKEEGCRLWSEKR